MVRIISTGKLENFTLGLRFLKVLEKGRAESTELRITRKTVLSEMTFKLRDQRVSFLLNEILEYGLLEHQKGLEKLYDSVNGNELHEIQCKVGDYVHNLNQ